MTEILFLGDQGKSIAFIMNREIERNWSFVGPEDKFFWACWVPGATGPMLHSKSDVLNLFKNYKLPILPPFTLSR